MSRGNDSRTAGEREGTNRGGRNDRGERAERNSRSSLRMTAERARAIQAHADCTGTNQDFKARTTSAAHARDHDDEPSGQ